jgi:hypothetical protein
VTVFLSFEPFPIPEPKIKDSRANNLQVEINRASSIEPAVWTAYPSRPAIVSRLRSMSDPL